MGCDSFDTPAFLTSNSSQLFTNNVFFSAPTQCALHANESSSVPRAHWRWRQSAFTASRPFCFRQTALRCLPTTWSSQRRNIAPCMQMNRPRRPKRTGNGANPHSPQRDLFVPVFVIIAITGYTLILSWDLAKSWLFN